MMLRWTWPGGHDDRFDPIAVEWLRRWGPKTIDADGVDCGCHTGRCPLCN